MECSVLSVECTTVHCRVWSGESADCGLGSVEYKEWNVEWGVLSGEC